MLLSADATVQPDGGSGAYTLTIISAVSFHSKNEDATRAFTVAAKNQGIILDCTGIGYDHFLLEVPTSLINKLANQFFIGFSFQWTVWIDHIQSGRLSY